MEAIIMIEKNRFHHAKTLHHYGSLEYSMDNEYVCTYVVDNLPKKPRGEIKATLHVDIEKNGNIVMKVVCEGADQEPVEKRVSCFDYTDEKLKKALVKIQPFCPK